MYFTYIFSVFASATFTIIAVNELTWHINWLTAMCIAILGALTAVVFFISSVKEDKTNDDLSRMKDRIECLEERVYIEDKNRIESLEREVKNLKNNR